MLGTDQLHRLTDYAIAMQSAGDYEDLARIALEAMRELIPCDWPSLSLATGATKDVIHKHSPCAADFGAIGATAFALREDDPTYINRLRLSSRAPATVHQFIEAAEFQKSRLYNEVWRPQRLKHLLAFPSPASLGFSFRVNRQSGDDFTDADRLTMHLLSRYLEAATERLIARNRDQLPVKGKLFPIERYAWLVCDARDGKVLRASSVDADRWLVACIGANSSREAIEGQWLAVYRRRVRGGPPQPLSYRSSRGQITAHPAPIQVDPSLYSVFFVLQPTQRDPLRPLIQLGLTQREAEVLQQMLDGKANAQIATELGITVATTKKHLENLFHKLGVSNRTGAVARARDVLH